MIVEQWLAGFSDEQLMKMLVDNMRQDERATIAALRSDGSCPSSVVQELRELM